MAKTQQKRQRESKKSGQRMSDDDSKTATQNTHNSIPLQYVVLIGILCVVAGAVLFPYVDSFVSVNRKSVPTQSSESSDKMQSTNTVDKPKTERQVSDVLIEEENGSDLAGKQETGRVDNDGQIEVNGLKDSDPKPVDLKSENVEKSGTPAAEDKLTSGAGKKMKEKTVKKKTKAEKGKKNELPKEIRDFKPTFLSEMTPKKIFADGRRIPPIELLPQKPNNSSVRVYMFEEFLSDEECDGLRKAHDRHVNEVSKLDPIVCFDSITTLRKHLKAAKKNKVKVSVNDFTEGTTCLNASFSSQFKTWIKSNWSLSTAFYLGESKFSTIYEQRAKAATGLPPGHGGKFQITSYPLGIGYNTHTDCIVGNPDKRDRYATMLVYLETVEKGGETAFPELGIWVRPKKGRALVWNNMNADGDCEPLSIHTAAKVEIGNKYILQRWYYYKSFYSLGKRPQEPRLPEREQFQPRVNCDEFEHGSCRWYDEWGYNHLLEYERQKLTLI